MCQGTLFGVLSIAGAGVGAGFQASGGQVGKRREHLAGRDSPGVVVPAVPGLRHSPSNLGSLRIEGTALRPAPTGVCHGARARPDGVLAMLGASASMGVGRCWEVRAPARGSARHLDPRCAPWRGRFVGDGRERSAGGLRARARMEYADRAGPGLASRGWGSGDLRGGALLRGGSGDLRGGGSLRGCGAWTTCEGVACFAVVAVDG